MKKKIILSLVCVMLFAATICGCSLGGDSDTSQIIYKDYINVDIESDSTAEYSQGEILTACSASVVSIVSAFQFNNSKLYRYYSGIIIDQEGYVLSCSDAAYDSHYLNAVSVYAVLGDIYEDSTLYKLETVAYDSQTQLALFRFVDDFYYFTNEDKTDSESGFQFYAKFSGEIVQTGDLCFSIGNNLGGYNSSSSIASLYMQQTVMSGTVTAASADSSTLTPASFNGEEYPYILTSASVSDEMIGGGLFDENGYLIGMLSYKLYDASQNGTATSPLTRVSLASSISLLCDYIDSVSEANEIVISYTLATAK